MWDFESIDSADITDENTTFELEPMLEIKVGSDVSIKSLARSIDPDTPSLWYCQDACGAIWAIDVVASHTVRMWERRKVGDRGRLVRGEAGEGEVGEGEVGEGRGW